MKKILSLLLAAALAAGTLAACQKAPEEVTEPSTGAEYQAFYDHIDTAYSLQVTEALQAFTNNETYGFRSAGSAAELAAGDYLAAEMEAIGLQNVYKDEIKTDTWEFRHAELTYTDGDGAEQTMPLSAYHVQYVAENEALELVYAGKGTEADYENLDVNGKLVLVDVDQLNEWWVNWPAYQAKAKGAKAVIAVNTDGYCTYSADTVGVQDLCGPEDAPVFSVSVNQADALKAAITAAEGSLAVSLTADSRVERNGTSYNIIGEIPGQTDEVIYLIGHYDSYFRAFGDNTSGIGGIMGIMKALVESGYAPQKTIRVIAHCAEEWGVADSRYDWAWGATASAWKHPEWAENAFVLLNIDGGLLDGSAEGHKITTSYELAEAVGEIGSQVEGSPLDGALQTNSPIWTWTEEFSYSQLGIPTIASGLYGVSDRNSHYHSSSDTKEANHYSDELYAYSQKLYGSYLIAFDQMTVRPFAYAELFAVMGESVGSDAEKSTNLLAALDDAATASVALKETSDAVTPEEAAAFNSRMNELHKLVQNSLYTIDWNEEYQFVHEYKQTNVAMLQNAIEALEAGDIALALDEYLWAVDLNWYAYDFDRATYDYFVDQVIGENARNSWGTGYIKTNADLFDVIRALQDKNEGDDLSAEIAALEAELLVQQADLNAVIEQEIADLGAITAMMQELSAD